MNLSRHLLAGHVIPAHPLALDRQRRFSERHQRALTRYYLAAGAGGVAVAVHSTQFEIREPRHALLEPVLALAAETARAELSRAPRDFALIAGVCGQTKQALAEAELAVRHGYHAALVSMAALNAAPENEVIAHVAEIATRLPVIGFYLQPAVGGRVYTMDFWRRFAAIAGVVGIKIAPFNRYQTIDVVRAVIESGREDIALYTGNDDTIVSDLLTPFSGVRAEKIVSRRIVGGLLGHWGVWTHSAVALLGSIQATVAGKEAKTNWWRRGAEVTDMNAAVFDPAHQFAGCIPGILEVLRRQGLVETNFCLNPHEQLSPGQAVELTRVAQAYPHLVDDDFVAAHRDEWLR